MHIILLIALLCVSHAQSYHTRMIYVDEKDNICFYGAHCDTIDIDVEVDGVSVKQVLAYGGTFCRQWVQNYFNMMVPTPIWDYVDYDTRMVFDDEITYYPVYFYANLKARIRSPALINGKMCNCTVISNG